MRLLRRRPMMRACQGLGLIALGALLMACNASESARQVQVQVGEQLSGEQLSGEQLSGEQLSGEQLPGEQLAAEQLFVGQRCNLGKEPSVHWINSASAWQTHQAPSPRRIIALEEEPGQPAPNRPEIDFSRFAVVMVGLGQKPTGGFGVTLAEPGVRRVGDTLVVQVQVDQPAPDAFVTQALTAPCVAVKVPRVEVRRIRALDQHGQAVAQTRFSPPGEG